MTEKHPVEWIEELLGDPLPPDWQDELAVQARVEHLSALASMAADAGLAMLIRCAELGGGKVPRDDATVGSLEDAAIDLEHGIQRFTHDTQRRDADTIARATIARSLGDPGAQWIMEGIERVRALRRAKVAAFLAKQQA